MFQMFTLLSVQCFSVSIYNNISLPANNNSCLFNKRSDKTGYYFTRYSCGEFIPTTYEDCTGFTKYVSQPESIDWRNAGIVTPVKNQEHCGSCWSFSATGAMESAWAKSKGNLISLSEQELVDCVKQDHGCHGGEMNDAFEYAIENNICTEYQDPYRGIEGKCIKCNSYIRFSECKNIPNNNQIALKEAVATYGPVSVSIQADQKIFQYYTGGIIKDESCGRNLDHGVLIVGYGEENGDKYWIVKNSWGENWGENGYVRILRSDKEFDPGICGIAMQASFPIV